MISGKNKHKSDTGKNLSFSDIKFLRINGINSYNSFDEDSIISLKLSLYTTLASIEEEVIGREINKLFERILPYDDPFKLSMSITQEFYEKNYIQNNCEYKLLEDLKNSLDSIINRNFNMEFFFFQNNVEELCKILVYSYLEMSNYYLISYNKTYNIKTYKDFLRVLGKIIDRNIDVIKRYRDKERDLTSVCSNSTRSSFSSVGTFSYKYSPSANEFEIPTEMIILLNKFQTIKKLKMFVPNKVEDLQPFIIILLNIEWLFPNLFELELDLTNGGLQKDIVDQFIINLTQNRGNSSNSFSGRSSTVSRKSIITNTNTNVYQTIIRDYKLNFELIVIYSYFISRLDRIKVLNLIFPNSFQNEIIEALKLSNVHLLNFQFINFLIPISNLFNLNVEFDSLDTLSFEKVLSIFHKNNYLKCFKMNLFAGEESYSTDALVKLCTINNINIEKFSAKSKNLSNEFNNEIEDYILQRLLETFQENLEKFFFILQSKLNLFELHLKAEIPRILATNENYTMLFQKVILNIFILLNNENCSFQTLKISMPYLSFDNRKYPGIGKFLDQIDMKHKLKSMYNLTISLQFSKVPNISNLISLHLKFLSLGELDFETFSNFIKIFQKDEDYRKKSELVCLHLNLSSVIFETKQVFKELFFFLQKYKPLNLREFSFMSNLIPSQDDFLNLISVVKYDRIEKYVFEFNKRCCEVYQGLKSKFSDIFYYIGNKKLNDKVFKILMALNRDVILNEGIFKNLRSFLQNYEKKTFLVNFK